jgi:threonine synthase
MDDLASGGVFTIADRPLAAMREDFAAGRADEAQTAASIRDTWEATGFLPDPHTAVGLAVARRFADPAVPMVTLGTAHPAKFPAAIDAATGLHRDLPEEAAEIMQKEERFARLPNQRSIIEDYIAARTCAVAEKV